MIADLGRRHAEPHPQIRARADRRDQGVSGRRGVAAVRPSRARPKGRFYLYGLIVVMSRLAAPWQLIRIATRAAESDDTARIAETPYAVAVTLVLGEIEAMVGELRVELKAGPADRVDAQGHPRRGARAALGNGSLPATRRGAANWRRSAPTFRACSSPRSRSRPAASGVCCGRARPRRSRRARCLTQIDVERGRGAGRIRRRLPPLCERTRASTK